MATPFAIAAVICAASLSVGVAPGFVVLKKKGGWGVVFRYSYIRGIGIRDGSNYTGSDLKESITLQKANLSTKS